MIGQDYHDVSPPGEFISEGYKIVSPYYEPMRDLGKYLAQVEQPFFAIGMPRIGIGKGQLNPLEPFRKIAARFATLPGELVRLKNAGSIAWNPCPACGPGDLVAGTVELVRDFGLLPKRRGVTSTLFCAPINCLKTEMILDTDAWFLDKKRNRNFESRKQK